MTGSHLNEFIVVSMRTVSVFCENVSSATSVPRFTSDESLACVAGGFGGRESRAKTSGATAGEMGREPRQSCTAKPRQRAASLAPFPRGFTTRFSPRAWLFGEPTNKNRQLRRLTSHVVLCCSLCHFFPLGTS